MSEIPKTYEPAAIEIKWYAFWEQTGCFAADPKSPKPAYSIVIPPPNVTGVLTLGHVLNHTIQDILARRARMLGKEVLWLPGTDHAGIATQNVVEKALRKEGAMKHRDDLGREALVAKIWEWKEKYGGIILKQLRALGASCDWSRTRFTMDEHYSQCVSRVFVDLYKKGLIYRGKRMVNWCPASLTALSDEEVVMKEQKGALYYFKVAATPPSQNVAAAPSPQFLTIATTRPETIPGDTAVAVNPNDPRYAHLIGGTAIRPLPPEMPVEQRRIPIIGDDAVAFDFGTGVLKVTPAHDKADFEIGERHGLPLLDIMHPNGVMNDLAGKDLAGMDRFDARKRAVELLTELGALEKEEPYQNNVGYSERADVPVEPRLSEQWFLKYPSVEQARACVVQPSTSARETGSAGVPPAESGVSPDSSNVANRRFGNDVSRDSNVSRETRDTAGETPALPGSNATMRFFPDRWAKVYDHWMEGIKDWCISRQLWWGHRVPVWSYTFDYYSYFSVCVEVSELLTPPPSNDGRFVGHDSSEVAIMIEGRPTTADSDGIHDIGFESKDRDPEVRPISVSVCTFDSVLIKRLESHGFTQDPDVLDTWFSSWLWPFATMGWPERTDTLAKFYPTTDLVTGPDIIFFWVARMIMAGFEWMGELPFKNVYFTSIIRDKQGRKLSKSLNNSPDPLDLIAKYGADAIRFGTMRSAPLGSDVTYDEKNIELGRNFCTKLWNAARFRQMQSVGQASSLSESDRRPSCPPGDNVCGEINPALLTSDDKWILVRLDAAIAEVSAALDEYRFSDATAVLYRFFWSEYCDWYVEASKASLAGSAAVPGGHESTARSATNEEEPLRGSETKPPGTAALRANTLAVMDYVLTHTLRLFHPFLPFITEELWQGMGFSKDMPPKQGGETIMFAPWPKRFTVEEREYFMLDESDERYASAKYEVVNIGRGLRRDFNIASNKRIRFVLRANAPIPPHEAAVLRLLLNAEPLEIVDGAWTAPRGTPAVLTPLGELLLPLEGIIDVAAERERLAKEIAKVEDELAKVRAKLADPGFAGKVPAKVIEDHQQRERDWSDKHAHLAKMRETLGA